MSASVIEIVTTLTATLPRLTPSGPTVMTPALNSSTVTPNSPSTPVGAIVGGVVGGIAVLGLIALGFFFILRGSKKISQNDNKPETSICDSSFTENQPQEQSPSRRPSDAEAQIDSPNLQSLGPDRWGLETHLQQQQTQAQDQGLQFGRPSGSFFEQLQESQGGPRDYGSQQDVARGAGLGVGMEGYRRQELVPVYQPVYKQGSGRTGQLPLIKEEVL